VNKRRKKMLVVNLTPHTLNIHSDDGSILNLPSVGNARCEVTSEQVETINSGTRNINVFRVNYGDVIGLPDSEQGVVYVTSLLVAQAVPHRRDVHSPGELIRNDEGKPIGCKGLRRL
jgi:hypothetical protein